MTIESNVLTVADFNLYQASTYDATPDTQTEVSQNGGTDWWTPDDCIYQYNNRDVLRLFDPKSMVENGKYGIQLFSFFIKITSSIRVAKTMLFDCGSDPDPSLTNTNFNYRGYGMWIDGAKANDPLEFCWRPNASDSESVVVTIPSWIESGSNVLYPPGIAGQTKKSSIYHIGAAMCFLKEGYFVDVFIEGSRVKSGALTDPGTTINPDAGLALWGTSRDPSDASVAITDEMNAVDAGFSMSHFFAQRLEEDRYEMVAKIMRDHCYLRKSIPAAARDL
jgi:hypothetical protein